MSEVLCLAEVLGEYDYVVDVDLSVVVQVGCWVPVLACWC